MLTGYDFTGIITLFHIQQVESETIYDMELNGVFAT